jgi:SAM-dependent methyltransferase
MRVIAEYFPYYRDMTIHECSPNGRGVSAKLDRECPAYSTSHYFEHVEFGQRDAITSHRCESLESLTYEDNTFDLLITQDVMEHVFNPNKAFREICRVLKPGGAHVFTVPIISKQNRSQVRALKNEHGETILLMPPEYHQDGIDEQGVLVTMHWGYDIVSHIANATGMPTTIMTIDDLSQGIRAEYIDVVVSWHPEVPERETAGA